MRRLIAFLLACLMLGCLLAACGNGQTKDTVTETHTEKVTDTDTATVTETETETDTETATETVTDTETDTETEVHEHTYGTEYVSEDGLYYFVCTGCGEREETYYTRPAMIRLLNERTEAVRQSLIGYGCPRDEDTYETVLTMLSDAGLTGILSGDHFGSGTKIGYLMEACDSLGLDLVIDLHLDAVADETTAQNIANSVVAKLNLFSDYLDCVTGIYLRDEATMDAFPSIGVTSLAIQEAFGDRDWAVFINCLPYGDPAYEPGSLARYGYEAEGWYASMRTYIEQVSPTAFCFDRYPWYTAAVSTQNSPQYLVANVLAEKIIADEAEIPMWSYLQVTSFEGSPTAVQFLHSANVSIACGVKTLMLFTAFSVGGFEGMIRDDGTATPEYFVVQAAMDSVNGMKCVYADYDTDKVILTNATMYSNAIREFGADSLLTTEYERLDSITSDGDILTGCMKNEEGNLGFFVVNTDYDEYGSDVDVTLQFEETESYEVWTEDGLVQLDASGSVTVTLNPGCAAFIKLTELD